MGYFVSQYGGEAKKIVDAINLIENEKIKTVLLKLLESIKDNYKNIGYIMEEFKILKNKINSIKDDIKDRPYNEVKQQRLNLLIESIISSLDGVIKIINNKQKSHIDEIKKTNQEDNTTKSVIYLGSHIERGEGESIQPGEN